ncbi:hypothetical protein LOZ53_006586 [Ophidiomyces ophidiicola]|uniref:uncharacterized protein n=1 Tax=Ophidiomyces ophidiicola TaxID=1387563 RepID=UPI0020C49008|nr:uncharacterized protein LOZ57_006877 [Ophidiomyces ophidiicola]KAI1931769.1 hypothetical protein LOZ62_006791 [Ophidiomyces ophidiicola]KAI1935705.1 hypothetical protein LOZ57_006877 [Ophidiomyces ophidiicola]KAI1946266.1 hypothetical protein LOZ59_006817 [Ophidiomyces ophidiicola]KAI1961289.1 hypothetical protein LOZ56_006738 [Ophidiomyces ophidiicola]KAI1969696.1 hypothetical protein LOZ55_006748 [Ophidiomyces ophidiicola]
MPAPGVLSRRPILNLPLQLSFRSAHNGKLVQRHLSTYRRLKQRFRVKPDISFGQNAVQEGCIIYNPPSSSPSVYRTPTKFLPSHDARRQLRVDSSLNVPTTTGNLPHVFKPSQNKKTLTAKHIEDMRQLRLEDPVTWSRGKLAKRFGCNSLFVGMVCEASLEKKAIQRQVLEAVRSRWGTRRAVAREDRELRKEVWARDR